MQAMILAAGFGTRLLPYSSYRPKPLFPLLNRPLLLLAIHHLQAAGCDRIVINCHHLRDQVRKMTAGLAGVVVQEESEILGTGGGLRRAWETFRDEPLLVMNGDIYHTIDVRRMYEHHAHSGASVTMAVHDCPRFNTVLVEEGRVRGFGAAGQACALAFTGVHVIDPAVLQPISAERPSCIIDRYRAFLGQGGEIAAWRVDQAYWTDIGTPTDYLALHGDLLQGRVPRWPELPLPKSPFAVEDGARIGTNVRLDNWCAIGRAEIGDNVTICRSVIWDGAVIPAGSIISDDIVVQGSRDD